MEEEYELEKRIWSEKDFKTMGWHDCRIHAMALAGHDMMLDIDYIFKWLLASKEGERHRFWVSPATLVFRNVDGLAIDIEVCGGNVEGPKIDINDIEREDKQVFRKFGKPRVVFWKYTIYLHQGDLVFHSSGYNQYIRKEPILVESMSLGLEERGGVSFSTDIDH
ncbi:MAG: hypothetical protein ACE5QF_10035 [Thermoplasmata archaeon]